MKNLPEISICIPAWQAEPFIERTLQHARTQTYEKIRILVSVDQCDDNTVEICRQHEAQDYRIMVFAQEKRLGWVGNTNFLLDRVDTEYFVLYFHDDIIQPRFIEALHHRLDKESNAASAHCDMGFFGVTQNPSVGCDYTGSAATRLGLLLVAQKGSPLRSLTRTRAVPNLRMPSNASDGFWATIPYLMNLFAAGDALHVPETLYLRWGKRPGGLIEGWKKFNIEQIYAGWKSNAEDAIRIIQSSVTLPSEEELVRYCLYLRVMLAIRSHETEMGVKNAIKAEEVHPRIAFSAPPRDISILGEPIRKAIQNKYKRLMEME